MSDSRIERALAEYWAAVSPDAPLPALPSDPVDAFIEVVDRTSHLEGAFHLLDASSDPYPGIAVGDTSHPWRIVWALQLAELEPFACDALPEITFYLDTLPDPAGNHRVYSHEEGGPGPYEFADLADALKFMTARVKHARGALDDALLETIEAEASTILEDEYEQSPSSGFFVFENVLEAPLPEAWDALSRGQWPEIELMGQPTRVDRTRPSWQRELSLRTLGLFLRDRRVVLPEGVSARELGTAHRRLIEHLQMLEESFELGLVPELVETLSIEGQEPFAKLAAEWIRRFDAAHGLPDEFDPLELEPPEVHAPAKARGAKDEDEAPERELPPEAIERLAALLRGGVGVADDEPKKKPKSTSKTKKVAPKKKAPVIEDDDFDADDDLDFGDDDHDEAPSAPIREGELTPFMKSMRAAALEAIQALVAQELIEIDPKEHDALALEMANSAADARSAAQMLDCMTRALVESDLVDEVYASDDEIERCLKRLMGG